MGLASIDISVSSELIRISLLLLSSAVLLYIMYSDLRLFRIPNWCVAFLFVMGIGYGFCVPNFDWMLHIAAFLLIFFVCFGLFHFGLLGGGDAKLIPVLAFWTGFAELLPFLLMMTGIGAILGIALAVLAAARARTLSPTGESETQWRKKAMPYGVAIGIAGIVFMAKTAYPLTGL